MERLITRPNFVFDYVLSGPYSFIHFNYPPRLRQSALVGQEQRTKHGNWECANIGTHSAPLVSK